jgi:hypothetical protein
MFGDAANDAGGSAPEASVHAGLQGGGGGPLPEGRISHDVRPAYLHGFYATMIGRGTGNITIERRSAIDTVLVIGHTETARHYSRASVVPRQALPNHVERIRATLCIHCW